MSKKIWIGLIILFFLIGAGSSFLMSRLLPHQKKQAIEQPSNEPRAEPEDLITIRVYQPSGSTLQMTEKRMQRRTKTLVTAEAIVEEYFKGPVAGSSSVIPRGVKLLGIYRDAQQMLYVDLSDEIRKNFQGDALSEYLLVKGLYDTLTANIQEIQDVKILVEGKETETIGGHCSIAYPLKSVFAAGGK